MFIIFGTTTRKATGVGNYLPNACPHCSGNLEEKKLKNWLTLFFIPVIPLNTVDYYYQCEECHREYNKDVRSYYNKYK